MLNDGAIFNHKVQLGGGHSGKVAGAIRQYDLQRQ